MVKIILKGITKYPHRTYKITELTAGVILINGGIQITLSNYKLSEDLKEFFEYSYKK